MIDPTDEMEQAMVYRGPIRERLAAVLAIVERDFCLKPRNHVFHPLGRNLDREHAGMGLACTLCAGPCRIDNQEEDGTETNPSGVDRG